MAHPRQQELLTSIPYKTTVVKEIDLPIPADSRKKLSDHLRGSKCHIEEKITVEEGVKSVEYEIVCERTDGKYKTVSERIEIPYSSWNIDRKFMDRCCEWVVDNAEDLRLDKIPVKIVIKTPIRGRRELVKFLFDKTDEDFNLKFSRNSNVPEEIFKDLKKFQNDVIQYDRERKLQREKLSAHLRPYQERAVQWMISRECDELRMENRDSINEPEYKLTSMYDGTEFVYYPYTDVLLKRSYGKFDIPKYFRGGILADEMGLGKTVVVLGVILNNPREMIADSLVNTGPKPEVNVEDPDELVGPVSKKRKKENTGSEAFFPTRLVKCVCRNRTMTNAVQCPECLLYQHKSCMRYDGRYAYFCSACWGNKFVKSKSTLIIVPKSLLKQWEDEISKHVNDDAWGKGALVYKGLKNGFVQPSVLGSYDVVLTTYDVLSDEFDYTNLKRNGLFLKQVPPILRVEWWRLCLDEAQMVEEGPMKSGHFIAGTMAKLLPAVNKWNVTGTPVRSSVDELYNLTNWIGVQPLDNENFWDSLMDLYGKGYAVPLFSILSQIFWRNSKEDVEKELTIPDVTTVYHPLQFTPIESSFYMREHDSVYSSFRSKLTVGSPFLRRLTNKGMTLEMILAPMLHMRQACTHHMAVRDNEITNQGKGDEKNYMTLGSLLHFLIQKTQSECDKSLKTYLDAASRLAGVSCFLKDWEEAADYYNKALLMIKEYEAKGVDIDVLQNVHAAVNLKKVVEEHRYISSDFNLGELEQIAKDLEHRYMEGTVNEFETSERKMRDVTQIVETLKQDVMSHSWERLIGLIPFDKIISRIEDKISDDDEDFLENINEDMPGTINIWLEDLIGNRNILSLDVQKLCEADVDDLVSEAVDCHLRRERKRYCRLCRCKQQLKSYKESLFANSKCKSHNVEILMGIILGLGESKTSALGACKKQMELLQAMKNEQKQWKAFFKSLFDLLGTKDRLITSKSIKDESDAEDVDVLQQRLKQKSQFATSTLRKKYGTLLYLQNLDKMSDRDPCPICFNNLEKEWCVLQCGHYYCTVCTKELLRNERNLNLPCPTCREVTARPDIGYVDITKKENAPGKSVRYSTKITAVIDILLNLKESDPSAKSLIFSTWDIVLEVLTEALKENGISHRLLPGKNPEKNLEDFKNPGLGVTALLFPISYGVTGLNLVEANHVFFIEPTVNMAEEMQAVARIHRMGQKKNTFVHRLYMTGTIEEKIHVAVKDAKYMPTYFELEDVQRFYDT